MFNSLSDRLSATFKNLRSKGRLSESDVNKTVRDIRLALLDADVALPVVKEFTHAVRERAMGAEVSEALNPAQDAQTGRREAAAARPTAEATQRWSASHVRRGGVVREGPQTACVRQRVRRGAQVRRAAHAVGETGGHARHCARRAGRIRTGRVR